MIKVLGLDPANKTGWCIFDSDKKQILDSGTYTFLMKNEKDRGILFSRFLFWLVRMVYSHRPQYIVYELPHHRGGEPTRKLLGQTTIIEMVAEVFGVSYCSVHTGTLKKVCAGHGKASKEDMIKNAKRYLRRDPVTDDEADAINVCLWACKELIPRPRRIIKRK